MEFSEFIAWNYWSDLISIADNSVGMFVKIDRKAACGSASYAECANLTWMIYCKPSRANQISNKL